MVAATWAMATVAAYAGSPANITLTGTVRDFISYPDQVSGVTYNPDFENAVADDRGIVQNTLGADGTPQYGNYPSGTSTTHGPADFDQWYHDTANANQSAPLAITLNNNGSGVYSYNNNSFFPIDNQLYGNGSFDHNFSFTYQLATKFTYTGSGDFTFTGDDDVFVFINNQLAIDLGGVHGAESQTVDLSTLGLTTGDTYPLDIFFAERHTSQSDFGMETSLELSTPTRSVPDASSSVMLLSLGCAGLAVLKRRFA